jgi:hypothetical protein
MIRQQVALDLQGKNEAPSFLHLGSLLQCIAKQKVSRAELVTTFPCHRKKTLIQASRLQSVTSIQLNSTFYRTIYQPYLSLEHRIAAMSFDFDYARLVKAHKDAVVASQEINHTSPFVWFYFHKVKLDYFTTFDLHATLDSILEVLKKQELLPQLLPQLLPRLLPRLLPEQIIRERLLRLLKHLALLLLKILRFLLSYIRSAGFMDRRRPKCTTMPWEIWPSLVVLWGVCWMFYPPTFYQNGNQRQHPQEDEQLPYFSHGIQPL